MRRDGPVTAVWRRLDRPGHDACKVEFTGASWVLSGTAVFLEEGVPAHLAYRVVTGPEWDTRVARVTGWLGEQVIDWTVHHESDGWRLDGRRAEGLEGCQDVDLGFTPATNLLQLQRLDLPIGGAAKFPVAWIDLSSPQLTALPQVYRRQGETTYAYESPQHGYRATLEIAPSGFVARYPDLWELEG
jgi:hypothetical protein